MPTVTQIVLMCELFYKFFLSDTNCTPVMAFDLDGTEVGNSKKYTKVAGTLIDLDGREKNHNKPNS